ncbi:MAG: DUF58 domain-containing protein [Crenarchaeota archaeon]|nr:MAG: DUF58 domain-containing protein [Thermoproteota archaeon]RDJ33251.1 MAG: DUF58 domain-containing protein [Thermoproteota archaeon]RDJ36246.1 MAG: DUF58 domain-containing protein [Thermoproteota archaeon]RDJ38876.1 MAG: DUF58 domain-containing protein [Thermoproteota archaeon]
MTNLSELLKKIKNLEINTKTLVEGMESGGYRSRFRGGGIEFSEVRGYMPGDDARRIDWNVSARYDNLFVKEFVEEKELNVYVVVDLSASNDFGFEKSKKELAFEITASLIFSALKNNDRVGMGVFTNTLEKFVPAKKGKRHMLQILQQLLDHNPSSKETNIFQSISDLYKKLRRRSVVIIISDFLSDSFSKPLQLLKLQHQVILVNISDIRERVIPDIGHAYLEDAESGEQILVNTSDKRFQEQYTKLIDDASKKIHYDARKLGIDMLNLSNEEPFDITFNQYFRNKMRSHLQ